RFDGLAEHVDEPSEPDVAEAVSQGRASLRVARLDDSGVVVDGARQVAALLDSDELDAFESLLTSDADTSGAASRLARLAAAGVALPLRTRRRPMPPVAAYGLPNCPAGAAARSGWSDTARRSPSTLATPPGAEVPGAVA